MEPQRPGGGALYQSEKRRRAGRDQFPLGPVYAVAFEAVVVHRIQVCTDRTLRLKRCDLAELGVDMDQFASLDYAKCQEIGAAVGFLECDGLIVPSARWKCDNLVLFTDNHRLSSDLSIVESTAFAWQDWARANGFID